MQIVLASASPRRRALLEQIGWQVDVIPSAYEEETGALKDAGAVVLDNAVGKGRVVTAVRGDIIPVVAADTVVAINGEILGKPVDVDSARRMLRKLSGRSHEVLTGVAVFYQGKERAQVCATEVEFRTLSDADIDMYIATGEPFDKAGAYGIQGRGALLVENIKGCYSNVVGLPLTMMYKILMEMGAIQVERY